MFLGASRGDESRLDFDTPQRISVKLFFEGEVGCTGSVCYVVAACRPSGSPATSKTAPRGYSGRWIPGCPFGGRICDLIPSLKASGDEGFVATR